MSQIICGIDPSVTGTGIAIGNGKRWSVTRFPGGDSDGKAIPARFGRYEKILAEIIPHLEALKPAVIFLEDYAYGSATSYTFEFGAMLRWHLIDVTQAIHCVAPSTLKKFAIGKGAGDKEVMADAINREWGQVFPTSDHADAFALYRLGLCACGLAPMANQAQREAVEKVVGKELLSFAPADVAGAPF